MSWLATCPGRSAKPPRSPKRPRVKWKHAPIGACCAWKLIFPLNGGTATSGTAPLLVLTHQSPERLVRLPMYGKRFDVRTGEIDVGTLVSETLVKVEEAKQRRQRGGFALPRLARFIVATLPRFVGL